MHEMSLAENVLQIIEESARTQNFRHVRTVVLEIGQLAAVEPEAMRFCFDAVASGSIAEGARLEMIDLPGRALCYDCMTTVDIAHRLDPCPLCGGGKLIPNGGDEMRIKDMEVV